MTGTRIAEDWIPTRQSLLSRLRDWDDAASWQDFFDSYSKLLYRVALKSGLSDAEAQEVVQETVITVAKQMPGFQYDRRKGSFKGWLLRTAQWRISDQFRKRKPHVPLPSAAGTETALETVEAQGFEPPVADVESHWDRLWEEQLLEAARERVRKTADPKEFLIFDLLMGKGWPAEKVAGKLQVSRARVYYAKYKVAGLIRKAVKRLEHDWGATPARSTENGQRQVEK